MKLKSGTSGSEISIDIPMLEDENVPSVLNPERIDDSMSVDLYLGSPEYFMGDPNARSMGYNAKPGVFYRAAYSEPKRGFDRILLTEKQLDEYFGIKIIEFTFSDPIKNTFK